MDHNTRRNAVRREVNLASRKAAPKHGSSWTQADLDYLAANFTLATAATVAVALGRTVEACSQMFYMKPERATHDRHQERQTTQKKSPGQRQWEKGFTDLSQLDW